ncbi:unknown protein [Seminavis robusta]|uniref:C3H1-type domain-containing protein n=1 Tax=Seminavis robusta TaxID=568900 RepID=A0A9N8F331_9STRA|nr:unknown protein [Seminavis robusta]|eukprot:Sro2865_g338920.1 n/a (834) ;mRNA; r:468-3228
MDPSKRSPMPEEPMKLLRLSSVVPFQPGMNNNHRQQVLGDPNNASQFACVWNAKVGILTCPVIITLDNGDPVVVGDFTDTIGEPFAVSLPVDEFFGFVTTFVRAGDAAHFRLGVHPISPDTVAGPPVAPPAGVPPPRRNRQELPVPVEATLGRLNFPGLPDEPGDDDLPRIAALPVFQPLEPGFTFDHRSDLQNNHSYRDTYRLFHVWREGMQYLRAMNGWMSVTTGGTLFHLPGLQTAAVNPIAQLAVRPRVLAAPVPVLPDSPLYGPARTRFATWSTTAWVDIGSTLEPLPNEIPPVVGGGLSADQIKAVVEPLIKRDKAFGSAERTAARLRILLAGLPIGDTDDTAAMVLPDLREEFSAYLSMGSSSTAGDDLRELVKARLVLSNASDRAVDSSVTFRPENITLAFSDRIRTFSWLSVRLLSASFTTAQSNLCLIHFLTPERDALSVVADGDHQARTILMANSTYSTAQIEATKNSQLYSGCALQHFRHVYEAFCNLRLLFAVMITDLTTPIVIVKMAEYVNLLMDASGKDLWDVYRNHPYLAIHPWQELQSILGAFLRPATNATLYAGVIAGTGVQYSDFRGAIATADSHIHDLQAILNGSGLGKFEGTPTCASWFKFIGTHAGRPPAAARPPAAPPARSGDRPGDTAPAKRQRVDDPAENDRKKTLGILTFDSTVAGTSRLPTVTARAKKRGSKTPERLCMKFLTQGFYCANGNDCKMPHIANIELLTETIGLSSYRLSRPRLDLPGPLVKCLLLPKPGPRSVPADDVPDADIGNGMAIRPAQEWYPTQSKVIDPEDITLKEVFTQSVQRRFRGQLAKRHPAVLAKVA